MHARHAAPLLLVLVITAAAARGDGGCPVEAATTGCDADPEGWAPTGHARAPDEPGVRWAPPPPDPRWRLCRPAPIPEIPDRPDVDDAALADIYADHAELDTETRRTRLSGDVILQRRGQRLEADEAFYDDATGRVDAEGNVNIFAPGLALSGSRGWMDMETGHGELFDLRYYLAERRARGTADRAELESAARSHYEGVTFTTCDPDPGRIPWRLTAGRLTLDQDTGMGTARHVRLAAMDVPLLYLPYVTYPIDDSRRSGFLVPSFGSSTTRGNEYRVPYYWNIAPHRDATITPHYMTRRGLMTEGEFRYLNPRNSGEVRGTFLPDDDVFDADRWLFSYRHRGNPWPNLRTNIIADEVSDNDYFKDFSNDLSGVSTTHLERSVDLRYRADWWTLRGRAQGYQTVDDAIAAEDRPYRRVPQLVFDATMPHRRTGLEYGLNAEAVSFQRSAGITGERLDVAPSISWPFQRLWGFFQPTAKLRHTQYWLDEVEPGVDERQTRTVPTYSVDTGLFFERPTSLAGTELTHTLEPRIYYLYTPFRDQTDLPRFDTGRFSFSFGQLFRDDRFIGADRVGDAHQITTAVTSRLLETRTGVERLRATLGQIQYFRDRRVVLRENEVRETEATSDLLGELAARVTESTSLSTRWQYNPHEHRTENYVVQGRYRPARNRIINVAYRSRRDILEQTDVSFLWPLGERWHVVGRWNYSLRQDRSLETLWGIEYESCCWAARLVNRRFVRDPDDAPDTTIMLQVELRGFTAIGAGVDEVLGRGILGYDREF